MTMSPASSLPQFRSIHTTQKELLSQHELYLKQHPEISQISSDYLKMLLQRKPDDVYQFTRDYFAMFLSEEQLREVHKNAANEDQPKATESIAEQQQRKEDVREDEGGASKRVKLEEDAVAQSADPVETPAAAASPTAESSSSAAVVVEDATSTNEDVTPVAELVDAGVAAEVTDVATDEPVASDVPVEVANDIIAEALATPATDVTSADTTSEPPKTEAQEESQ